jgi:hypothetical protein
MTTFLISGVILKCILLREKYYMYSNFNMLTSTSTVLEGPTSANNNLSMNLSLKHLWKVREWGIYCRAMILCNIKNMIMWKVNGFWLIFLSNHAINQVFKIQFDNVSIWLYKHFSIIKSTKTTVSTHGDSFPKNFLMTSLSFSPNL